MTLPEPPESTWASGGRGLTLPDPRELGEARGRRWLTLPERAGPDTILPRPPVATGPRRSAVRATLREPSASAEARGGRAGITLLETMFALVLVALIAGVALPWTLPGRGAVAVEAQALRVAALLRADRNAALRFGRPVATTVDLPARTLSSGAGPGRLLLADNLSLRFDGAAGRIEFSPDGRSSGGALTLAAGGVTARVSVNPVSAAVTLAGR